MVKVIEIDTKENEPWCKLATIGNDHAECVRLWNGYQHYLLEEEGKYNLQDKKMAALPELNEYDFEKIKNEIGFLPKLVDSSAGKEVFFTAAVFKNRANFSEFYFGFRADFHNSHFKGYADFGRTHFEEDVNFVSAHFERYANFHDSHFEEDADFHDSHFESYANFHNSHFKGYADFRDSRFESYANFYNSRFEKDVTFHNSHFEEYANFHNSRFEKDVTFSNAHFKGPANFRDSHFEKDVTFSNAHFKGDANFHDSHFKGDANFRDSHFKGYADFVSARFEGDVNFQNSHFEGHAYFRKAFFKGEESYFGANKDIPAAIMDFSEAEFINQPPYFYGRVMHHDTNWTDTNWTDAKSPKIQSRREIVKGFYKGGLSKEQIDKISKEQIDKSRYTPRKKRIRAYECLAIGARATGKTQDEQSFVRLGMRETKIISKGLVWLAYWLYDVLSDYGFSITRPLLGLLVTWLLGMALLSSLSFSIENACWQSAYNIFPFYRPPPFENATAISTGARVISLVQSVCGPIFLFLFGLGLRSRFRLR